MRDLRQKVLLQSGKTVSRKKQAHAESSRPSSVNPTPNTSPGGSRVNSRPGSRYASEDEDGSGSEYDDAMTMSTLSASDDGVDEHGPGKNVEAWPDRLRNRITDLLDRKHSSVHGREGTLRAYVHLLRYHYASQVIDPYMSEIIPAILKSIRSNSSEEQVFALQALSVTLLTCPSQIVHDPAYHTLKGVCEDAEDETVKVEALRALSVSALYGGGSSAAHEEACQFFMEIIESDGAAAGADDNGAVVTAAMQAWALVASYLTDLQDQAEEAMEAFMEQLDSTDPDVQASAGSNIALLFETVREYEERTEETLHLQYNQHRIMTRLSEIVRDSSKGISRKDRKHLRSNLTSVVISLEQGKGPGYSTAGRQSVNPHKGSGGIKGGEKNTDRVFQEFGYREKVRVGDQVMLIDSWSLQARVDGLKTLLGGGFAEHFMQNPLLEDILEDAEVEQLASSTSRKSKRGDEEGFSRKPPKYAADVHD